MISRHLVKQLRTLHKSITVDWTPVCVMNPSNYKLDPTPFLKH
jgi:hypothetical protein